MSTHIFDGDDVSFEFNMGKIKKIECFRIVVATFLTGCCASDRDIAQEPRLPLEN